MRAVSTFRVGTALCPTVTSRKFAAARRCSRLVEQPEFSCRQRHLRSSLQPFATGATPPAAEQTGRAPPEQSVRVRGKWRGQLRSPPGRRARGAFWRSLEIPGVSETRVRRTSWQPPPVPGSLRRARCSPGTHGVFRSPLPVLRLLRKAWNRIVANRTALVSPLRALRAGWAQRLLRRGFVAKLP